MAGGLQWLGLHEIGEVPNRFCSLSEGQLRFRFEEAATRNYLRDRSLGESFAQCCCGLVLRTDFSGQRLLILLKLFRRIHFSLLLSLRRYDRGFASAKNNYLLLTWPIFSTLRRDYDALRDNSQLLTRNLGNSCLQ